MNIIEAIRDDKLFRPYIGDKLQTWRPWLSALRVLYGLPERPVYQKIITECTGRDPDKLPRDGFDTALFLTGRRSGKSRIAAVIGAFEAVLAGHEKKLSKGEKGIVSIIAPTRRQSQIVRGYLRSIFESPMLAAEVVRETGEGFDLRNGVSIEILTGDWRSTRGFTLVACVIDEACFFGLEAEAKVRSDTELITAIRPGLATVKGKLICISSPYAKKGWAYSQWKKGFGNDKSKTLVWNCPSRTMNPTLPQSIVDEAMEEDRASALAEYFGQFRDDVSGYLPRDVIERVVAPGRLELQPRQERKYFGFVDMSGGRVDSATLSIAHRNEKKVVIDFLREWRPPFNPTKVIADMANDLRRYHLRRVTGDNYSGEFTASGFKSNGIHYSKCDKPKAELYREFISCVCSEAVELLDSERLINQLSNLERRTRSGGKDIIDHPSGGHDDLANAIAGVADTVGKKRLYIGALR